MVNISLSRTYVYTCFKSILGQRYKKVPKHHSRCLGTFYVEDYLMGDQLYRMGETMAPSASNMGVTEDRKGYQRGYSSKA